MMSAFPTTLAEAPMRPRASGGLPRLLAGVAAHGSVSLDEHMAIHGELPLQRRRRRHEAPLIAEIEASGLRGHGGAGFPTAQKLRAVAATRRRSIVVVNAAEGEPASLKDRMLCQTAPHLMLDGAQLAAQAVSADELVVCVCASSPESLDSVAEAIEERSGRVREAAEVRLSVVSDGYVAGQESALVNYLNGGPAIPRFTPPMPFEQGVRRRPTLLSNAETFAHVALIARHGADWFRQLGTTSQPGSALLTLSGPVASPGVYEIEHGASLASVIDAASGPTGWVRAALFGGYAGSWIEGRLLAGVALSDEHLAVHDATFGAGVVALISENACPVAETVRVATWLAGEGAGQCGPCVNGLDSLAATLQQMLAGTAQGNAAKRIERLASLTRRRGACAHPDGAVRFILSAVQTFAEEFADHARHGPCEACAGPPELPLPAGATSGHDPWNTLA
jgi:NADH:ubiquinone oxidoreductase subunit F (NADH-binding)